MKEKGDEIRDCNYDRDTGFGDFNRRESGNVALKKPRIGNSMQRQCKMGLTVLHDSLARVLAYFIVWFSRVYLCMSERLLLYEIRGGSL